jgi:hypothetical protein
VGASFSAGTEGSRDLAVAVFICHASRNLQ